MVRKIPPVGGLWRSGAEAILPGHHATGEILNISEAGGLEDHAGLTAAVATAAVTDNLLVFQLVDGVGVHLADVAKRQEDTTDIKFLV